MSQKLALTLVDLKRDEVIEEIRARIEDGENPMPILNECRDGMKIVGDRFQTGDFFLAEMLLAAEIFKAAMEVLNPVLSKLRSSEPLGKVLLATIKGDIHDLGKSIFGTIVKSRGFEVFDLGVDVEPGLVVEKAGKIRPDFIGFSALLTSCFDAMKQTADLLAEAGLREKSKLMIGGGVTTDLVRKYVGADFQTTDAMDGVNYCLRQIERS